MLGRRGRAQYQHKSVVKWGKIVVSGKQVRHTVTFRLLQAVLLQQYERVKPEDRRGSYAETSWYCAT